MEADQSASDSCPARRAGASYVRPPPARQQWPPSRSHRVPRTTTTTADQATIGKSLVIKGEVTGSESLYIDGRVEGSINLAGNRVTVGRNGVVAANINAREIVVLGKVRGNLTASDRVDIRSDGSLTGDVIAARISIEDGAFFKGGIDIRKGGQAQPESQRRRQGGCGRASRRRRPGLSFEAGHNLADFAAGTPQGCPFCFCGFQAAKRRRLEPRAQSPGKVGK